ncbi:MAG: tetratricopeptide repeat protein, partial [Deltaproteobacteria bacterium]|nr:tetratricopeptide repeat protein [Deltaproteobacteria bacterium]
PSALFSIGQCYQLMGFNQEASAHYEILQERFPGNLPYTADSYYHRGETFLALGKRENAIDQFTKFLEDEGNADLTAPAYYQIGDAYYNLGRFDLAKTNFNEARRLDPKYGIKHPLMLFHIGETYYESAEFDLAREVYQELLAAYPQKPYSKLAALRLGDFLRDEGKESNALALYKQVMEEAPRPLQLRGMLRVANVYANRPLGEDYKQALELYEKLIREPQEPALASEAMLRKALTLTLHKQYPQAIQTFEELAKTYPKSPYVRKNIVQDNIEENLKGWVDSLYETHKDWEVVNLYAAREADSFSRFPFRITLFQVASSYANLGLYDQADKVYQKLEKIRQDNLASLARYRIARALMDKDNLGRAETAMLEFITKYPDDEYTTDVRMALGLAYLKARRYPDALKAFRIIVQDFEKNPTPMLGEAAAEAYFNLAMVQKELGQYQAAAEAFANVVPNFNHPIQGAKVPPFVILSQFYLGDALFELKSDDEALEAYQKGISLYPDHDRAPWAWYQMGLIHRRNGREPQALELFNTLVEMAKNKPGEMWEPLAKENQRELVDKLQFRDYLNK